MTPQTTPWNATRRAAARRRGRYGRMQIALSRQNVQQLFQIGFLRIIRVVS